ncbi:MAG: recombinase family protein [Dehalococcoidia bacterium]
MQATAYRHAPTPTIEGATPNAPTEALLPSLSDQAAAIEAACARHDLELVATYTDAAGDRVQFHRFAHEARITPNTGAARLALVLPTLEVLGETARDRAMRALQLAASGQRIEVDGAPSLEAALLEDWRARSASERHRERVREGMRRRALRGQPLGRPPYGYRVAGHRLEVEPAEADVVREVARMYLREGLGVRRIAAALNDRGLRTRRGGPWSAAAIRDMLRNPVYIGTYRRLGVIVAGAHPSILSRPDFDDIQHFMQARRTAPSEQERHHYALSGLARCGYCGNRLIGVRRPGTGDATLVYYQCESATNHGRCSYHTRRAEDLEREVLDVLASGEIAPATANGSPAGDTPVEAEIRRLEGRREGLDREVGRAVEHWATGEWSWGHLVAVAGPRALDALEVDDHIRLLSEPPRRGLVETRRDLVEGWNDLTAEERRARLQQLMVEIVVTDDAVRVAAVG